MFDVELFGMCAGGHQLMGLALHVANTALLFWLLASLAYLRFAERQTASRYAAVAALFAAALTTKSMLVAGDRAFELRLREVREVPLRVNRPEGPDSRVAPPSQAGRLPEAPRQERR